MVMSEGQKLRTISAIVAVITLATQLELAVLNQNEAEIIALYEVFKIQPDIIKAYLRGLTQNLNDRIKPNA